ncbi:antiviral reverse transcriptase Drt3a [Vibrio neptunius]|uniref:RNA-directed DNA polymerase n=1 Tax=Vibrio neptunius TaxID=170651 RepID=A0ABS3A4D4_9VIBR|nr:antiviral reverse transcriptase Drt3a [Vibrio neptunius]MBN3494068.1 RNA-directed DNA polymerase [Vibrio neptunius]MBN3516565.1 RNA-directed DNA polymerase [Vibrio neptunius]MBN3550739.1 RNA-directed DNA polymerase [Vibrio neptunius]MBN3578870.1 RNA-directed DNA polymerase [Vibrio neptunius]MCH9872535.1 RNA-directed DNA polymerase [Vibrio neptunius]
MLDQSISEKNIKTISSNIWHKWNPSKSFDVFFDEMYTRLEAKLEREKYLFSTFKCFKLMGKDTYDFCSSEDEIVCKKLNDNIRRLFKINAGDRHAIVKQVISLLSDTQPIKVLRLDIKEFYETVDRDKVLEYVINEWLLSHQNRCVLKCWDDSLKSIGVTGLPRGMSLSSTLSEIRIRPFDREVRKLENVYYYARFVDDIIIMFTGDSKQIMSDLEDILKRNSPELSFNDKTKLIDLNCKNKPRSTLDYLGYQIITSSNVNKRNKNQKREVIVKISDKKIGKIKYRVRRSFSSYVRTRNFRLLLARLEFLTGNQYIIGDIERTRLKSGIYYNYPLINDSSQVKELDKYYQKLINTKKGSVAKAINYIDNYDKKAHGNRLVKVKKLSFYFGFSKRVMNSFNRKDCRNIKRCW